MTTDLQPYQAELVGYQDAAYSRLNQWAEAARATHEVSVQIVETSFCPEQFRKKPHEATAAILAGMEVGLSPMSSLNAFDVIQGRAAPKAITLRAIVQSQGHEILLQESTATRCIMAGRRKGSDKWQRSTWTIDRASALNLTGKGNWKQQPAAMLIARATSEIARLVAADAILGIAYSSEELADGMVPGSEAPAVNGTSEPEPTTKRMSRPKRGPSDDDIETQKRRMHALFKDCDITDHDGRVAYAIDETQRDDLTTTNDLTFDERAKVIVALERVKSLNDMEPPA